jgi:phosphoribosylanthranilate isomerase
MPMPVKVKVCGVTRVEDALVAAQAGAAAVGLNFYPPSPRCVSVDTARAIVAALPPSICPVGVFVDEPREHVAEIARTVGLRALQFHGNESPADCGGWSLKVIKALRVRDRDSLAAVPRYPVDFILLDAYVEGRPGGTGSPFAWDLAVACERSRLILAGGLTPDNVAEAVRTVRPAAVDVASGVESMPGIKDAAQIRRFIANAHGA